MALTSDRFQYCQIFDFFQQVRCEICSISLGNGGTITAARTCEIGRDADRKGTNAQADPHSLRSVEAGRVL